MNGTSLAIAPAMVIGAMANFAILTVLYCWSGTANRALS